MGQAASFALGADTVAGAPPRMKATKPAVHSSHALAWPVHAPPDRATDGWEPGSCVMDNLRKRA
jgi:hypothetical protein